MSILFSIAVSYMTMRVILRASCKKQELLTLRKHMSQPRCLGEVNVARHISFLCYVPFVVLVDNYLVVYFKFKHNHVVGG
jgi:hypothetical protein